MKKIRTVIFLFFLTSCSVKKETNQNFTDQIIDLTIKTSSGEYVELPDLYNKLAKNIPNYNEEKLILVQKLKAKGFKITDWGHGNYPPLGPRIVSMTLRKDDCECVVDKIYYLTAIPDSGYEITERIKCANTSH